MIPDIEDIKKVHRRYALNDTVYKLVFEHCQIVAEIALGCVKEKALSVNQDILFASCMLHDIGTYALFDESGRIPNGYAYKQHAIFGAALVIEEGFDKRIADAVRTHVLMGLSKKEIVDGKFGMPQNDYFPTTLEARLLCYADRFHTKHPTFNSYDTFLSRLAADLPLQAEKFRRFVEEFGLPDIDQLAKKYNHPIR